MTQSERFRFPPCLARIMAKHNRRLMSDPYLMEQTGWSRNKLIRVYNSANWLDITERDQNIFLAACGLSTASLNRARWLVQLAMRRGGLHTMQHLKCDTGWKGNQLKLHLERIEKLLGT